LRFAVGGLDPLRFFLRLQLLPHLRAALCLGPGGRQAFRFQAFSGQPLRRLALGHGLTLSFRTCGGLARCELPSGFLAFGLFLRGQRAGRLLTLGLQTGSSLARQLGLLSGPLCRLLDSGFSGLAGGLLSGLLCRFLFSPLSLGSLLRCRLLYRLLCQLLRRRQPGLLALYGTTGVRCSRCHDGRRASLNGCGSFGARGWPHGRRSSQISLLVAVLGGQHFGRRLATGSL
jgi:hypothetical protein